MNAATMSSHLVGYRAKRRRSHGAWASLFESCYRSDGGENLNEGEPLIPAVYETCGMASTIFLCTVNLIIEICDWNRERAAVIRGDV